MTQRSAFDQELSRLDDDILKLGSMCETAIEQALKALAEHQVSLAQDVIVGDTQINHLRYDLEERCYKILATQQPAARDLRHIIAVIHIASELERIGDHASGIARLVERIEDQPSAEQLRSLPKMGKRVQKMIRTSMQAFITRDPDMAINAIERDDKVDREYGKFSEAVLNEMDGSNVEHSVFLPTYLLWVAHNLERIGDRVTNIGERIIYMITGKFIEEPEEDLGF